MSAVLKTGADARAMLRTKFPPEFNQKVDMKKVNVSVIKKWVADEVARILKSDDDVVPEMIFTILEGARFPNIKELQTTIAGFLDKDVSQFCLSLWKLCLSAQANPNGIPQELLDAKKHELIKERVEEERAREAASKRHDDELAREREITRIREQERGARDRGRNRGGQFGRDPHRHQQFQHSRSPPRRRERESNDSYRTAARGTDSYVPRDRLPRGVEHARRHRRSPSYSRSPPRATPPPRNHRRRYASSRDSSRSPPPRRQHASENEPQADRAARSSRRGDRRSSRRSRSTSRHRTSFSSSDGTHDRPNRLKRRITNSPSPSPPRRSRGNTRRRSISRSPSRSRSPASPPRKLSKKETPLPKRDLISTRQADQHRLDPARLSRRDSDRTPSKSSRSPTPQSSNGRDKP